MSRFQKKNIFLTVLFVLLFPFLGHAQKPLVNEPQESRQLEKEIRGLISQCQVCEVDNDCFVDKHFVVECPFGCNFFRSHSCDDGETLSLIEEKIQEYKSKHFMACDYECVPTPEQDEIGCRENKCVDLRYYTEKE